MDDEEMQKIRRAVDESKQQFVVNHGDEQRRMRESAIAARSGAIQDNKTYLHSAGPGGPEQKKPVAGAPKGIPMTMIVSQPTDQAGGPVQFIRGELQENEAKQKVAETRLPTLPALPRTAGVHDEDAEADVRASILVETATAREAIELPVPDQFRKSELSVLEQHPGFYVHCQSFLPRATPEQHFEVFGVRHQFTREEWDAFVKVSTDG